MEARTLLDGAAGYVLEGTSWADPRHITYSIAPDGIPWDGGTNDLNTTLDAQLGAGAWQREIARALQTWASVADIDIVQVADGGQPFDATGSLQGDPRFGDIRIGGRNFNSATTLAQTYPPPPNGWTAAGDSDINTGITFQKGTGIDLYSVVLHEFGHALGLGHSPDASAVMNATYGGVRSGLSPDDIAGIRAIYGPRVPDTYAQHGQGTSASAAIDVTPSLNASHQADVTGLSLATIGATEYFNVTAPSTPGAGLVVKAVASDSSLLSPKVTILGPDGKAIDTEGNAAGYGDDIQAKAGGLTPGGHYTIAVTGATDDVFAVGAYHLQVALTNLPVTPNPTPQTPAPSPQTPAPTSQATPIGTLTPPGASAPASSAPTPTYAAPVSASSPDGLDQAERFVNDLYRDFLGRDGGKGELDAWVAKMADQGQQGVASSIIRSPEAESILVDRLYRRYLGRSVDQTGLGHWLGVLQAGGTEEQVIVGLLGSTEYAALAGSDAGFVQGLYTNLLGRAATPAEVSATVAGLRTAGPAAVVGGFVGSVEFRADQVATYYTQLLGRPAPPSAVELQGWAGSTTDLLGIEVAFAGTPEYYARP